MIFFTGPKFLGRRQINSYAKDVVIVRKAVFTYKSTEHLGVGFVTLRTCILFMVVVVAHARAAIPSLTRIQRRCVVAPLMTMLYEIYADHLNSVSPITKAMLWKYHRELYESTGAQRTTYPKC